MPLRFSGRMVTSNGPSKGHLAITWAQRTERESERKRSMQPLPVIFRPSLFLPRIITFLCLWVIFVSRQRKLLFFLFVFSRALSHSHSLYVTCLSLRRVQKKHSLAWIFAWGVKQWNRFSLSLSLSLSVLSHVSFLKWINDKSEK